MKVFFLCLFSSLLFFGNAQNGTPDLSFGDSGRVVLTTYFGDARANDLHVLPNNNMLLCGPAQGPFWELYGVLARFLPNGKLDSTFAENGKVNLLPLLHWSFNEMAVQADGKIVVAGTRGTYNFAVFRFLENGIIDSSFADNGIFTFDPFWFNGSGFAESIALQSDGKIVVCGEYDFNTAAIVVRLNTNGTLDSSFNGTGKLTLEYNGFNTSANSLALQTDGKIVIAGTTNYTDTNRLTLFRVNGNGTFDYTFGSKGIAHSTLNGSDVGRKALLLPNGKIMVVGNAQNNGQKAMVVQRWQSNGTLDANYATGGQAEISFADYPNASITNATLIPDQSLLISIGGSNNFLGSKLVLARVFSDGQTDNSFGINGKILLTGQTGYDAVCMADSSHFFAAGFVLDSMVGNEPLLAKYTFQISIGIKEFSQNDFKIYPNPSSGTFTISTKNPGTFALYNNLGLEVWRGFVSSEPLTINLEHAPAGLYFMLDEVGASQKIILSK